MDKYLTNRCLYFFSGFVLPSILIICGTILMVSRPDLPHLQDVLGAGAAMVSLCIVGTGMAFAIDEFA